MLLKSESQSISGQSSRVVSFNDDAMGNSTSAIIACPATTATLTRRLAWGQDLAGSPSLQGAGGVGGLLMVEEITSTTNEAYHFHYDGNGNVTEITDHLGVSVATYRYDAFGNTLVATGTYAATNRYRFSTKPLDHEVTTAPLYYYGYRYLDPLTGRWPSRDPIAERGGVNLYGFVGNDGVRRLDVIGLSSYSDIYRVRHLWQHRESECDLVYSIEGLNGNVEDDIEVKDGEREVNNMHGAAVDNLLNRQASGMALPETYVAEHNADHLTFLESILKEKCECCQTVTIVLLGHSWGGGAATDVADSLAGGTYGCGYLRIKLITVDAIRNGKFAPPHRGPSSPEVDYNLTFDHKNYYQTSGGVTGMRIIRRGTENVHVPHVNHQEIDDDVRSRVANNINNFLNN